MDDTSTTILKKRLVQVEGLRRSAYQDTNGFWTIGVGRLIDARRGGTISDDEAFFLLDNDIKACLDKCQKFLPGFNLLDSVRQAVLIELCFNLGFHGLLGFPRMLAALSHGNWPEASRELLNSQAARQLSIRYHELSQMILTGQFPSEG